MDDPDTLQLANQGVRDELPQCLLGLGHIQTVQIDLALNTVLTAPELPQHGAVHALPVEHQLLAAGKLRICGIGSQTFLQHRESICPSEARFGGRPSGCARRAALSEWLHVPDRLAEQPGVILIELGIHATV